MKPSALKRKRCAQLFATNRAQIHPRNAENSLSQPQGVKLDTHVAGPLLHSMLPNPTVRLQVYGLPSAANLPDWDPGKCLFRTPGTPVPGTPGGPRGRPKWTIWSAPPATSRRPEGRGGNRVCRRGEPQAPFQTRDYDRGSAGRGQSSSQSQVTPPEFHPLIRVVKLDMFTLFWSEVSPPTIDVKHDVYTLSWSEVSPPTTNKKPRV